MFNRSCLAVIVGFLSSCAAHPVRVEPRVRDFALYSATDQSLYFDWDVSGVSQIWRVDGPMHFPSRVTSGPQATHLEDVMTDGKTLVTSSDAGGLSLQSATDPTKTVIFEKTGARARFAYASVDSKTVYYLANDLRPESFTLYAYDLEKKARESVYSEPGDWDVTDVLADSLFLMTRQSAKGAAQYWSLNLDNEKATLFTVPTDFKSIKASYGRNAEELFLLGSHADEPAQLYRFSQGQLAPLLPEITVANFKISSNRLLLLVQSIDGHLTAYEPRTMKAVAVPPLAASQITSVSRFGRYSVLTSLDAARVGSVFDYKDLKITPWIATGAFRSQP